MDYLFKSFSYILNIMVFVKKKKKKREKERERSNIISKISIEILFHA